MDFSNRFLKLTVVGYFLALLSVGGAVWFASQPILLDMQREALAAHLRTKANIVANVLDEYVDEGRYAARQSALQAFVLGQVELEKHVRDQLSRSLEATNIRLIDFQGQELLQPPIAAQSSQFSPVEAQSGLAQMVSGQRAAEPVVQYRPGNNPGESAFLISIPVTNYGHVEGTLSFEIAADLSGLLASGDTGAQISLLTLFQASQWSNWHDTGASWVEVKMPGSDFYLSARTDTDAVTNKGRELMLVSIAVAFLALLFPFTALGALGLRAIVLPHRRLLESQTELAQKSERLAELARIAEMASESVIVTDSAGEALWVNNAFRHLTGYEQNEIVGKKPGSLLQGSLTDQNTVAEIRQSVRAQKAIQREIVNYTKSGEPYWVHLSISPIPAGNESELRFASIATDITEIKKAHESIAAEREKTEHQATHDALTKLPNRRFIDRVLAQALKENAEKRILVRIDLDHFKHVNDTLGHAAGDFVLTEVARVLNNGLRKNDVAARVGGDEFVILLKPGTTEEQALDLTERLRHEIQKDILFEGHNCRVGASFGISATNNGFVDNDYLLKSADAALYIAKEAGRNQTVFYSSKIHADVVGHREMSAEIERGLARNEFVAYFQPQFEASTGVMIGVEALARWLHPQRGIVPPAEFMPVAEKLKVVAEIDNQIFAYGLESIAELNADGLFIPKIAFNVGATQMMNPNLRKIVEETDIGLTHVALEVLESVLVEGQDQLFLKRIQELRAAGFSIEVDDFGSGHASVISLTKLEPSLMKIDRELVLPLTKSDTARKMIKCVVDLGHTLGIDVLAEGVETAEHASILRQLGCDAFQGYHFAMPMSFDELRLYAQSGFDPSTGKLIAVERPRLLS